jgi:hypothetical protein
MYSCLLLKVSPLVPLLLGEVGEILLVPTRVAPPAPTIPLDIFSVSGSNQSCGSGSGRIRNFWQDLDPEKSFRIRAAPDPK